MFLRTKYGLVKHSILRIKALQLEELKSRHCIKLVIKLVNLYITIFQKLKVKFEKLNFRSLHQVYRSNEFKSLKQIWTKIRKN